VTDTSPLITVAIPTFGRLDLLRRAVDSVQSQTYSHWTLVVSDDEDPSDETWNYLLDLSQRDRRIRAIRNGPRHGQVGNTNNALMNATGAWVKLLHDDDVLRPNCLERLAQAVSGLEGVAIVSCLATYVRHDRVVKRDRSRSRYREIIHSKEVPLAMYLQEAGPGEPTRVMVHRRVIEAGTLFEEVEGLVSGVDSDWSARASRHGDLLLVNEHLVELHDDNHSRVTTALEQRMLDAEYEILRRRQFSLIDPSLKPPRLEVALGMVRLIRAINRVKRRDLREAICLARTVRTPQAWALALRWAVRQLYPGALCRVKRIVP
jgi:glycosyltransferase involved in cell wall biosynthesis